MYSCSGPVSVSREGPQTAASPVVPCVQVITGQPVAVTPSKDLTGGGIVPPPPKARQTLAEVLTQSPRPPREGDPLSPKAAAFTEAEAKAEAAPAPAAARPTPRPAANAEGISSGG